MQEDVTGFIQEIERAICNHLSEELMPNPLGGDRTDAAELTALLYRGQEVLGQLDAQEMPDLHRRLAAIIRDGHRELDITWEVRESPIILCCC